MFGRNGSGGSEPEPTVAEAKPTAETAAMPQAIAATPQVVELEPQRGSKTGLLIVLAVAIVIPLVVVFVGRSEPTVETPPQPVSTRAPPSTDGPQARPPGSTHTEPGDPKLAALLEDEKARAEAKAKAAKVKAALHPRDPKVIPPGTPEESAKAFSKLPVSMHDQAPVGAIAKSGLHIDMVELGRDYDNGCVGTTEQFSATTDMIANVCFRAVHARVDELVWVIWEKDGVVTRRGKVRIRDIHAYKTRAYLKLRPEYLGSWTVRISPEGEDGTDLAVVDFEIVE